MGVDKKHDVVYELVYWVVRHEWRLIWEIVPTHIESHNSMQILCEVMYSTYLNLLANYYQR